jgi:hypothetical protein
VNLLEFSSLRSNVRFGVGSWKTWSSTEMFLGFSVFACSKEDGVGTYKNSIKKVNKFNTTINNLLENIKKTKTYQLVWS